MSDTPVTPPPHPAGSPFAAALPDLDPAVVARLDALAVLLKEANARLNLVSRGDVARLEEAHMIPCLALARWFAFPARSRVLDLGTGGGLPGLPLAVMFPQVQFFLLDSVGKKVRAVAEVAKAMGLRNVEAVNKRVEDMESTFDWVTGRAVTSLPRFLGWAAPRLRSGGDDAFPRGVFYFKGTLWRDELAPVGGAPDRIISLPELIPATGTLHAEKFLLFFSSATTRTIAKAAAAAASEPR